MSFLEELESLFGAQGLYEVLNVGKTASESDIKRAYRRLSLKVHPDRVHGDGEKERATKKFQALCKVYSILSNKELRAVYDETGEVGEEIVEQERDWLYYWRVMFPQITTEDISKFEKEYKGSDEELKDLKEAYVQYEGDMDKLLETVLCASVEDEERFRELLQDGIDNGELPQFDTFIKHDRKKKKARKVKAKKEAAEAEELAKELGIGKKNDLASMIMKRQTDREAEMNNFFAGLEDKYCQSNKSNSKKRKISKSKK